VEAGKLNKKIMNKKTIAVGLILPAIIILIFILFGNKKVSAPIKDDILDQKIQVESQLNKKTVGLANPASVYCEQNGGKLEIVTAEDGSQSGMCTLANGNKCEEWSFFRGECGK